MEKNLRREARRAGPQVCGREADLGPALLRPERARGAGVRRHRQLQARLEAAPRAAHVHLRRELKGGM